jgi:uncharacterized protein with HEPN domain
MRPEERDPAYLWDMLEASGALIRLMGNLSPEEFLADENEKTRFAVERALEILGEAARRVSSDFQEQHPEIPWKQVVGLRNVISHQYDKVDYEEIHRIVSESIPRLVEQLKPLVPAPPDTSE